MAINPLSQVAQQAPQTMAADSVPNTNGGRTVYRANGGFEVYDGAGKLVSQWSPETGLYQQPLYVAGALQPGSPIPPIRPDQMLVPLPYQTEEQTAN